MDTIARVRRAFHVQGWSVKKIVRELHVSRNTVRKILRSDETDSTDRPKTWTKNRGTVTAQPCAPLLRAR